MQTGKQHAGLWLHNLLLMRLLLLPLLLSPWLQVCPPGCDPALYESVVELREHRQDNEDVAAEVAKALEALGKDRVMLAKKAKLIDTALASINQVCVSAELMSHSSVPRSKRQHHTFSPGIPHQTVLHKVTCIACQLHLHHSATTEPSCEVLGLPARSCGDCTLHLSLSLAVSSPTATYLSPPCTHVHDTRRWWTSRLTSRPASISSQQQSACATTSSPCSSPSLMHQAPHGVTPV